MEWKFRDDFEFHVKPIIRKDTEPYQIMEWFVEAIEDRINDMYEHNIIEFIYSESEYTTFDIYVRNDHFEFHGIGIMWMKKLRRNYKEWFYYIVSQMKARACPTVWDIVYSHFDDWYYVEHLHPDKNDDKETALEKAKELRDWERGKNRVINREIEFKNIQSPKNLMKPRNEKEKEAESVIKRCLDLLEIVNSKEWTLWDYNDKKVYEDGGLELPLTFVIFEKYCNADEWTEYHVMEQFIDMQANGAGISPWTACIPEDKQFDEDGFDFRPIQALENIFNEILSLERKYEFGK